MEKMIEMEYPDGIHKVIVTQADITNDGRIVISYYDLSDNMSASFSEIVNIGGKFYKNPNHKDWEYYVLNFRPFDYAFSNSIVNSLSRNISLLNMEGLKKKTSPEIIPPKKEVIYVNPEVIEDHFKHKNPNKNVEIPFEKENYITAVMYANRGGSLLIYDNYSDLQPVFFKRKTMSEHGPISEVYKKAELNMNDELELCRKIEEKLGSKVDISLIPEDREIKLSNGKTYYINFASCDDNYLFQEVAASEKVSADISMPIDSTEYPDNLSLALHHVIPLEVTIKGTTVRYEANSNFGRKKI
jgi:hypothetical protein